MTDSTPQPPCIGPDGHVAPDTPPDAFSAIFPDFADVRIVMRAAVVGERCTGLHSTVTSDWGTTGPGPHIGSFAVGFDPPRPEAPLAYVAGTPGAPGITVRLGRNKGALSLTDQQRLLDAYQTVITGAVGSFSKRGRKVGSTDVTREEWGTTLALLKPQHPRLHGHDGLIHAMAQQLLVSIKTINRYHKKEGWPL